MHVIVASCMLKVMASIFDRFIAVAIFSLTDSPASLAHVRQSLKARRRNRLLFDPRAPRAKRRASSSTSIPALRSILTSGSSTSRRRTSTGPWPWG